MLFHFFNQKSNSGGVNNKYQGSTERMVGVIRLHPSSVGFFLSPNSSPLKDLEMTAEVLLPANMSDEMTCSELQECY